MHVYLIGKDGKMGQALQECLTHVEDSMKEADIVIDFSSPSALHGYLPALKIPTVIGTTGFGEKEWQLMQEKSQDIPIFYAENFSLGIFLFHKFIHTFKDALKNNCDLDFFEAHHKTKKDSPSGTALKLMAELQPIPCHVSRAGGICGIHTLQCAFQYEMLEIKHTAWNRKVFAEGAIKAAAFLLKQKNGLYGMDDLYAE